MLFFQSDYTEGAHEKVLEALSRTNFEPLGGYGTDPYTERAKERIRLAADAPDADIFFLVGGTQTNMTVIDTVLPSYGGVISPDSGHVALHEAGAIEFTGHKVIPLPAVEGKLSARTLEDYLTAFHADENASHMVYPGMVYLSYPTEYGTLYSKEELTAISRICRRYAIPLYLDGARLGYGLMSDACDLSLSDIATLCDVFYIGGTKVGALCGEAVVFPGGNAPKGFLTMVKQHGALLAKGRLTGVQFDALFCDNLYFRVSRHADLLAMKMRDIFRKNGFRFLLDSPTNQQFVILENRQMEALAKQVTFSFWGVYDANHTVVRFATSWATKEEEVEALDGILRQVMSGV